MAPQQGAIRRFARRVRLYVALTFLAFGIGTSLSFVYYKEIFRFLFMPAGGNLSPFDGLPVFTNPIEMMDATFSIALKGGLIVAAPVVVFSIYRLVRPILDRERRRFLTWFLPVMGLFYLGGTAFAYYVMLPFGLRFLLRFGRDLAVPMITVSEYLSLVSALVFWLGVVFEIPLVMYLLAKLRLVSRKKFSKIRIYVPVAALFLAGFITPTTDPYNQVLVAGPIVALYEAGMFLAWIAEGGHKPLIRKLVGIFWW